MSCPGMGAKGNAYDNAVAESFFSNLKNERVHHCVFEDRGSARPAIFSYIELFYNRKRLNQSLGYKTPDQFEPEPTSDISAPKLAIDSERQVPEYECDRKAAISPASPR